MPATADEDRPPVPPAREPETELGERWALASDRYATLRAALEDFEDFSAGRPPRRRRRRRRPEES